MAAAGELDNAIQMVRDAPLTSQNIALWSGLIKLAFLDRRINLAFDLFVELKRRGFKPSARTYRTLMTGYARTEAEALSPKQLERVHSIYRQYRAYCSEMNSKTTSDPDMSVSVIDDYLAILAQAGLYDTFFEVFYTLDAQGPLAPNRYTYTRMMSGIKKRRTLRPGEQVPHGAEADVKARNASDAKFLWMQLIKSGIEIDSHVIAATIFVLAGGKSTEQNVAFGIMRDYLGLIKPDEPPAVEEPKVALSGHTLSAVLELCNAAGEHHLTIHFARLAGNPSRQPSIIHQSHMKQVLEAHAGLSTPESFDQSRLALQTIEWMLRRTRADLRPDIGTFSAALLVCQRCSDWAGALRLFEIMSGYNPTHFAGPLWPNQPKPTPLRKSKGRAILPDAQAMSSMARTALATKSVNNMRQCLRIMTHFGPEHFFLTSSKRPEHIQRLKDRFYQSKLAEGTNRLVKAVLPRSRGVSPRDHEAETWTRFSTKLLALTQTSPDAGEMDHGLS